MKYLAALVVFFVFFAILPETTKSQAKTSQLCEQKVEYSVVAPDATANPELRAFSGVWSGNVTFQPTVEMCVALVVEKIEADGKVDTKFVWLTGSSTGIENLVSLGAVSWSGKIEGDTLRLVGTNNGNTYTYVFRPKGMNEMTGSFFQNSHQYPLALRRRQAG